MKFVYSFSYCFIGIKPSIFSKGLDILICSKKYIFPYIFFKTFQKPNNNINGLSNKLGLFTPLFWYFVLKACLLKSHRTERTY